MYELSDLVDPMTTPTKTIPVPVDVLRELVDCINPPDGTWCEYCDTPRSMHRHCPIPALREALERVESTCNHEEAGLTSGAIPAKYKCKVCWEREQ